MVCNNLIWLRHPTTGKPQLHYRSNYLVIIGIIHVESIHIDVVTWYKLKDQPFIYGCAVDFCVIWMCLLFQRFRARDILENTDAHHPEEGIEETELGDMSANILARVIQGENSCSGIFSL